MKFALAILSCFLVTSSAASAAANDRPAIGPAPDWVLAPVPEPVDPAPTEGAVQVLLSDEQVRMTTEAVESYVFTRVKIQTPQGLELLGTLSFAWKPDMDVMTVHRLNVVRGDQVQDLLADDGVFTVLRREDQLERAVLTGMLTAVVQPAGLRVGDTIEMSYTLRRREPVLHDMPSASYVLAAAPLHNVRLRLLWPDSLPLRWRASSHMPAAEPVRSGGWNDLAYHFDRLEPLLQPTGAPSRFMALRMLEVTSFRDWQALSQRLAPLYAQASRLAADSPLRTEADRIRRQHATPVTRAAAALRLVQDDVRYVFLAINDGGLNPAPADETWRRRFGDCKAKSAVLLALLRELDIEAEVVAVSTTFSDGLDARLPGAGVFDHVLVRARIGARMYWLDGTRTGDRDLERLQPPPFRWALPLSARGSALVAIPVEPLDEPSVLLTLDVDASGGAVWVPAPFTAEMTTRGDAALELRRSMEGVPDASREEALRVFWRRIYPGVEIEVADVAFDEARGVATWTARGKIALDWDPEYLTYEPHDMSLGFRVDLSRPRGTDAEAPYAVDHPVYTRTVETIRLPTQRQPFKLLGEDINQTVAGGEYRRTARVQGGVFTAERSYRSIQSEFPASQRTEAERALLEMSRNNLFLQQPPNYLPTSAELLARSQQESGRADDYFRIAADMFDRGMLDPSRETADKALAIDPKHVGARLVLSQVLSARGELDVAAAELEAGLVAAPDDARLQGALVSILVRLEDWPRALDVLDRMTMVNPGPIPHARRAYVYERTGQTELALREADAAISADPTQPDGYREKAGILAKLGRRDEIPALVAEMHKAVGPPAASGIAITVLTMHGMGSAARIYMDEELERNPTADGFLSRSYVQDEKPAALADLRAALNLSTDDPSMLEFVFSNLQLRKWYAEAVELLSEVERTKGTLPPRSLGLRGVARWKVGDLAAARADFAAASRDAPSSLLNTLCWDKATYDAALEVALLECNAALAARPDCAACVDSKGLVLLRLGRFEESIQAYTRALQLQPDLTFSLFGRGIARVRNGQREEGEKDMADARRRSVGIALEFMRMGITADSPAEVAGTEQRSSKTE